MVGTDMMTNAASTIEEATIDVVKTITTTTLLGSIGGWTEAAVETETLPTLKRMEVRDGMTTVMAEIIDE